MSPVAWYMSHSAPGKKPLVHQPDEKLFHVPSAAVSWGYSPAGVSDRVRLSCEPANVRSCATIASKGSAGTSATDTSRAATLLAAPAVSVPRNDTVRLAVEGCTPDAE